MSQKRKKRKSNKQLPIFLLSLVLILVIGSIVLYFFNPEIYAKLFKINNDSKKTEINTNVGVVYDDFQIHFMTLGNDKAGDSIYIKAGDNDILIDAGSRSNSSETTIAYMDQYIKDAKLEYVIATHGDQDHIEAFPKILDHYSAEVIINNKYTNKTSQAYKKMIESFDKQVSTNNAKHFTADECFDNKNGAKRQYKLSDKVTMDIIYNYYYWNNSSDENNYSVCTMFTYSLSSGDKHFLLTGDLEKEGETKLVEYYDSSTSEKTLPEMDLYKAGHHGSKTSSNENFLSLIKPKMCVVSCCCGTDEYTGVTENQFPTQDFINRIAKWTDEVYVTSIYESFDILTAKDNGSGKSDKTGVQIGKNYIHSKGRKDMNGNVIVSCTNKDNQVLIGLACSNNTIKLKDSEWMNTKIILDGQERLVRTMPKEWQ